MRLEHGKNSNSGSSTTLARMRQTFQKTLSLRVCTAEVGRGACSLKWRRKWAVENCNCLCLTRADSVKDDAFSVSSEDLQEKVRNQARKVPRHKASHATPPPNDSINKVVAELEPADLPLPASPIPSAVIQAASAIGRDASALVQKVRQQERSIAIEGRRLLKITQGVRDPICSILTTHPLQVPLRCCQHLHHYTPLRAVPDLTSSAPMLLPPYPAQPALQTR